MDARLFAAVSAAKLLRLGIKLSGGGGTAAPGLLAEYIDPKALRKLGRHYSSAVFVTGTNGKTTTSRLLGNILSDAKIPYIHNRSGSNLLRGLIGTLVENVSFSRNQNNLALLEVDELTLPVASSSINPKVIIFNNLFRDQLDRYGEVDKIRTTWQRALAQLDQTTILALNSDDHAVAHLASSTTAKVIYFGIEDTKLSVGKLPHAADFTSCIVCGGDLRFDQVYLSHLGKYKCSICNLRRPKPDVFAENIVLNEEKGFVADIATPKGKFKLKIQLPGVYNVYNTLAAISGALALEIPLNVIKRALQSAKAAFGRTEQLDIDGKKLYITLVKNPSGFNEILRLLLANGRKKYILIAVNDLIADGRDVSWLWDVDFEDLFVGDNTRKIWLTGVRARDMALRIKYANNKLRPEIQEDLELALESAVDELPRGETLYVLPTYTAMLSLKKMLAERNISDEFWED